MSNQIQHIKISRAAFDTLTEKSEFAIYFVTEVDDSISLYTGSNAVSEDIRMVDTLPDTENAIIGKVYYNEADVHPNRCAVLSHCGFDLISLVADDVEHHFMCL